MLHGMTPIEYIDYGLLALGGIIVVTWLAMTAVRGAWSDTIQIPSGPTHRLTAFDVILGAWVFLFFRQMGMQIALALDSGWSGWVTTQSTTQPVAADSLAGEFGMLIGSIVSIVAFVAIGAARFDEGLKAWRLGEWWRPRWQGVALVVTIASVSICFLALSASDHVLRTVFHVVPAEHEKILLLQREDAPAGLVAFTVLGAVVVAPLVEEFFFRGLLLPALIRWLGSPIRAVVVSSVLFGLIHQSVPATVVPLTIFGAILAVAYLRSKSLAVPMMIHMLFNARTVVMILLGHRTG